MLLFVPQATFARERHRQ